MTKRTERAIWPQLPARDLRHRRARNGLFDCASLDKKGWDMRYILAIAVVTTSVLSSVASHADPVRTVPPQATPSAPKSIEGTASGGPDKNIKTVKSAPFEPVTIKFPTKK